MASVSLGPSNDMPYATVIVSGTATTLTPIAAVTGQIIRVYGGILNTTIASTVTLQDSVGAFTGGMAFPATGFLPLVNTGTPWFISAPGASFQIVNSAGVITGVLYYTQNKFGG